MSECEGRHHHRALRGWDTRRGRGLESCHQVPLEPFQERFRLLERHGEITLGRLCRLMGPGWTCVERDRGTPRVKAHLPTARRRLGLSPHVCSTRPATTIDYDTAVRLSRVLGMDPTEAGV